jgi:hypothetical protein
MGVNAQTSVPAFTAGQVLTAAEMTEVNTGIPVFATTVTRDAAFGGTGEKVLAQGQYAYIEATSSLMVYSGSAWVDAVVNQVASFTEYQASGTNGGSSTAGSFIKRTLNTTLLNTITGCTLTASVISLPAGTYEFTANSITLNGNQSQIKLRNTTDSTDVLFSTNEYQPNGTATNPIAGSFTIAGTKNFEIQYRVITAKASDGLGVDCGFTTSNCYTNCLIRKVA